MLKLPRRPCSEWKCFQLFPLQGRYLCLAGGVIVELFVVQRMNVEIFPTNSQVEDHMKRSYSILLLIGMVLALFVAACGSQSNSPGPSNQPETVTIWHGWQGSYLAPKQAIFNAYMQLHPNVTIKLVNVTQRSEERR